MKIKKQPLKHGQVGENSVWDGPIDLTNLPKGKGSSSGKNGLEISKAPFECDHGTPITSRAKSFK